jgi:hypothetical protein
MRQRGQHGVEGSARPRQRVVCVPAVAEQGELKKGYAAPDEVDCQFLGEPAAIGDEIDAYAARGQKTDDLGQVRAQQRLAATQRDQVAIHLVENVSEKRTQVSFVVSILPESFELSGRVGWPAIGMPSVVIAIETCVVTGLGDFEDDGLKVGARHIASCPTNSLDSNQNF